MTSRILLCIAGGGTGGHVMPALSLADIARQRWSDLEVEFIGAERGLEARLMPERGERVFLIAMHAIQGASLLHKLRVLCWEMPRAVSGILGHWRRRRPGLVVGVGGYASVAGVTAAIMSRIPVVLYEQNAVPGLVNRRLAMLCNRIMLGFSQAAGFLPVDKCITTGNQVHPAISAIRWQAHSPPRLLILGGSLGAAFLNEVLPAACALLKGKGREFTVRHVTGTGDDRVHAVEDSYRQAGIKAEVIGFCSDMPGFYASGDMLVARAGAMTVSEAAAVGMPCLFIPLPHAADNHQLRNAEVLATGGAGEILDQRRASVSTAAVQIERLLFDRQRLEHMSLACRQVLPANAGQRQLDVLAGWLEDAS